MILEGKEIEPSALALIVREAEGSVRDGLSLLDQVFSFAETKITTEDVVQVLGLIDRTVLLTIARALLEGDRAAALTALEDTFSFGVDLKRFCADLLECFRTLILCKIEGCSQLLDMPDQEIQIHQELASGFSMETIHLKLALLMQSVEEMGHSMQPRLTLETTFLKIIEAGNVVPVATLLGQLQQLLAGTPKNSGQGAQPTTAPAPPQEKTILAPFTSKDRTDPLPAPAALARAERSFSPPTTALPTESRPEPGLPETENSTAAVPPADIPTGNTNPIPQIHAHERDVRRDWPAFIDYVKDRKVWMSKDLQRADSARQQGNELHLHYSDPANCALLRSKENRILLTEFVLDFFQKELKVRFILPTEENKNNGDDTDSPQKQRHRLANDPLVQMAVDIFNGQIGDIRIGPRSR